MSSHILTEYPCLITFVASIRAYGAQNEFIEESMKRIDKYTRTARTFTNLNRWINIRLNFLGSLLSTGIAAYLVYAENMKAYNVGFSLAMTVGFNALILEFVRGLNEFEVRGNRYGHVLCTYSRRLITQSLERIIGYIDTEQEEKGTDSRTPPAYWPASGDLRVENLYARYSTDGPHILHDLNFTIKSGERIGVGKNPTTVISSTQC